jgi:hypothetical protein
VRFAATLVFWLATTVGLAVAVPAMWTQRHVVDVDGYTAIARQAAADPAVQSAMAAELTSRAMALAATYNGGRAPVDGTRVHAAAAAFTAGPAFPPLFARANLMAHDWLFTEPRSGQDGDQWMVDLAPMLGDPSIRQLLDSYHVKVPATLAVPLTLLAARSRGKALTSLGVSALLVGAAGWAGIEVGARYVNDALGRTTGNVRQVADVMVADAQASAREWLDLTLAAGAGLVVFGVLVAIVGGVLSGKQGS